jgi:hypothetical protein
VRGQPQGIASERAATKHEVRRDSGQHVAVCEQANCDSVYPLGRISSRKGG